MQVIVMKILTDNLIEAIKAMREITIPRMGLKEAKENCECVRDGGEVIIEVPEDFNPNYGYANCFLFKEKEYRPQYILEQNINGQWITLLQEDIPNTISNATMMASFAEVFNASWDYHVFATLDKHEVVSVNRTDGPLRVRIR